MKRETPFFGALCLLIANLFVKVVGVGFKIPLHYLLSDEGMGYFNAAYHLYTWFFMISTTGLPVAISTLVAEARARGEKEGVRQLFTLARALFCGIGTVGTLVMCLFAGPFAALCGMPEAVHAMRALAPALFFSCLSGAYRGYFEGGGVMVPTALSQVAEAVGKLCFGILLALYAVSQNLPLAVVSAYAIAGVSAGCALSCLLLFVWGCCQRDRTPRALPASRLPRARLWELVRVALPVTLASSVLSLTAVFDTLLLPHRLQSGAGYARAAAVALYGNYTTLVLPFFHLPTVLFYPITCTLLPSLTAARTRGNRTEMQKLIGGSARTLALLAVPAALGLSVFAEPILALLFSAESARLAAPQLVALSVGVIFYGVVALTNTLLQATGRAKCLVRSALCGVAVKVAITWYLAGSAATGIYAAPLGTVFCYLTIAAVNLFMLGDEGHALAPHLLLRPLLAMLPALAVGGTLYLFLSVRACVPALATIFAIAVVAVLYLLLAVRVRDVAALCGRQPVKQKGSTHERTSQDTRRQRAV